MRNIGSYIPFGKGVIKENLAYKGTFYLYVFCKVLSVFVSFYLWKAIYSSSGKNVLAGFSDLEMFTYVFMSFVCSNVVFISMTTKIGNDVMDGSIAVTLVKPLNYKMKLLSESIGEMIYRIIVPSIFVWIGVEVWKMFSYDNYSFSIINTIFFLISSLMGFLIYFLFEFCFGMLAFYSTYVWGMEIIKNAALVFLTGQLIPLEFYPKFFQKILLFLPFASLNYVPVKMYLGKMQCSEICVAFGRQILWIVILELISVALWRRVIKRVSILGG